MSGGAFDYKQYHITDIADEIERLIANGGYSKETLDEFRASVPVLRKAAIYAQRIDWLVSGDDGEATFHERIKEDLEKQGTKL